MYKILIIGYGSIGEKHHKLLKSNKEFIIRILTNRKDKKIFTIEREQIAKFNPDYVIISSYTSIHGKDLKYVDRILKNKKILVEKPLFNKYLNFKSSNNNKILINYNLRLHPVINFIKNFIEGKKLIYSSINCFSYLPSWRKNIKYQNSNSAKKNLGGGVVLELSHEIDIANYLFGIKKIHSSFNKKVSNLKINTDDILSVNLICKKIPICNLQLNFFDRLNSRKIRIVANNFSIVGDLINNYVIICKNKVSTKKYFKTHSNFSYIKTHENIIKNKLKNISTLKEGLQLMKIISKIKKND